MNTNDLPGIDDIRGQDIQLSTSQKRTKKGFFAPSVNLLNRLNYPVKFILISVLLDVPSLILILLLTSVRNENIDFGQKEIWGDIYNRPLKNILIYSQEHRTQMYLLLSGREESRKKTGLYQQLIDEEIARMDSIDQLYNERLEIGERWKNLKVRWKAINKLASPSFREQSYREHTEFIDKTLELMSYVGDVSNLILDPDIDSYYIMDATLLKYPQILKNLALARDKGIEVALGDTLSAERAAQLIFVLPGVIRSLTEEMRAGIEKAYLFKNANASAPKVGERIDREYQDVLAAIEVFLNTTSSIRTVSLDSASGFNPERHYAAAQNAIDKINILYNIKFDLLDELIGVRINALRFQRTLMQIGVPFLWFVVIYLLVGFYRSVMRTVESLDDISKKLVAGDTREKVELEAQDELAQVGEAFNVIGQALVERNVQLEENKKQLEESIRMVEESFQKLAESNEQLAESNRQIQEQQTQLIQSEKMASLGQMVAGIAHEVNTPLGFVRNNIEVLERTQARVFDLLERYNSLRDQLATGELQHLESTLMEVIELSSKADRLISKSQTIVNESLVGVDRIQELVMSLKDFSRLDETAFKPTDINQGIESTLKIANNVIKHKVEIVREFADNVVIDAFPARLNQVFLNLITNASQACEDKGLIVLKTYFDVDENGREVAVIKVKDNGKGIEPENMKKIFEPFFTTKPIGQGTGLGLSIVFKIIEQHKGSIHVESEVGQGTEFTIKLPKKQVRVAAQTANV